MFFMHRGHGSYGAGMGCCGEGHSHGSHNHNSQDHNSKMKPEQENLSQAELASINEAEYELIDEQPERQTSEATDTNRGPHSESEFRVHKVR